MKSSGWLPCVVTASVLLGCSKEQAPRVPAGLAAPSPNCTQSALQVKDVAGILSAPITQVESVPGDPQSCQFGTGGFPAIVVSIRPKVGRADVDAWMTGKMPLRGTPMGGIGDGAVWEGTLHELVAQKNSVLCDIQIRGTETDFAVSPEQVAAAAGAWCNRIFKAYGR